MASPTAAAGSATAATPPPPPPPALRLSQLIHGVPPAAVYAHLADPLHLLGLQPLLTAVKGLVRHGSKQAEEAATSNGPSAVGDAGTVPLPARPAPPSQLRLGEVQYEAVEVVRLCWGLLPVRNRIHVRQQLLGAGGSTSSSTSSAAPCSGSGDAVAPASQQQLAPLRMLFHVTSPPAGLVRLEVLWTFAAADDQQAAAVAGGSSNRSGCEAAGNNGGCVGSSSSSSSDSSTLVQLEVWVQAPWLLRLVRGAGGVEGCAVGWVVGAGRGGGDVSCSIRMLWQQAQHVSMLSCVPAASPSSMPACRFFVVSQAQQAQQELLARLARRLEGHSAEH